MENLMYLGDDVWHLVIEGYIVLEIPLIDADEKKDYVNNCKETNSIFNGHDK